MDPSQSEDVDAIVKTGSAFQVLQTIHKNSLEELSTESGSPLTSTEDSQDKSVEICSVQHGETNATHKVEQNHVAGKIPSHDEVAKMKTNTEQCVSAVSRAGHTEETDVKNRLYPHRGSLVDSDGNSSDSGSSCGVESKLLKKSLPSDAAHPPMEATNTANKDIADQGTMGRSLTPTLATGPSPGSKQQRPSSTKNRSSPMGSKNNLQPVLDKIILSPNADKRKTKPIYISASRSAVDVTAAGLSLSESIQGALVDQTKSQSMSTLAMSGYERFDDQRGNATANGPAVISADQSTTTVDGGDIRIEVSHPTEATVTIQLPDGTEGPGYISDPAGNPYPRTPIGMLRYKIQRVVEHIGFRLFTVLLIILDLILVVVDLSVSNCVSSNNALEIVSHIIITFFVFEVALRIFCKGKSFFYVILDVLDMGVVIISFVIDMVFLALSPESCEDQEEDQTAFARLIVIGRVVRIIRIARILYIAYTQRRHVSTATRQLVSQNKRRYQKDGFDLDLCYITERVIAMSFPSKGLMAVYRNPVEEVARFFNTKHKDHYRIYNLCSERDYDETLFFNNVERVFIDDHNVPKVREMLSFAEGVRNWMAANPANVIAIHCKGGKGRTGTMICVWLIECGIFESAQHSLEYFGDRRTDLSKGRTFQGVETPSQSRYVGYFEKMKNELDNQLPPRKVLKIKSFKIEGIGKVGNGDGSDLFMELRQDNFPIFECHMGTGVNCKVIKYTDSDSIIIEPENCPSVEGDIKVMFKTKNKKIPIGYDKCPFYFWFYTSFIEENKLVLQREELDNPHKPKTHHVFGENFTITVSFEDVTDDAV